MHLLNPLLTVIGTTSKLKKGDSRENNEVDLTIRKQNQDQTNMSNITDKKDHHQNHMDLTKT